MSLADLGEFISPPWLTMNDLTPDYVSAREWMDGGRPYDPVPALIDEHLGPETPHLWDGVPDQRNAHPPSLILLLSPLALLPYEAARVVWLLLSAVGYAGATALFAARSGYRRPTAIAVGVAILALPSVRADLRFGQSSAMLLALLVWAGLASRAGRDRQTGAALGIAAALKVFPAFLIIPLLVARRWRAAGHMVAWALAVSVVGIAALGWDATSVFLGESGSNARFWAGAPFNRSLVSLPMHWLRPNAWFDAVDAPVAAYGLALLLLALLVIGAVRARGVLTGERLWDAVPFMLLAAPLSWEHYFPLVIPAALLLVVRIRERGSDPGYVRFGLACLAIVLLCDTVATAVLDLTGIAPISSPGFLLGWAIPLYCLIGFAVCAAAKPRGGVEGGIPASATGQGAPRRR